MRMLLLLPLLIACNSPETEMQPDAPVAAPDSLAVCRPDTNRFGDDCAQIQDGRLFTECTIPTCEVGVCAVQWPNARPVCLRYCHNGSCPAGERAVGAAPNLCICLESQRGPKYPVNRVSL